MSGHPIGTEPRSTPTRALQSFGHIAVRELTYRPQ
jgi:hypothetical protein